MFLTTDILSIHHLGQVASLGGKRLAIPRCSFERRLMWPPAGDKILGKMRLWRAVKEIIFQIAWGHLSPPRATQAGCFIYTLGPDAFDTVSHFYCKNEKPFLL